MATCKFCGKESLTWKRKTFQSETRYVLYELNSARRAIPHDCKNHNGEVTIRRRVRNDGMIAFEAIVAATDHLLFSKVVSAEDAALVEEKIRSLFGDRIVKQA